MLMRLLVLTAIVAGVSLPLALRASSGDSAPPQGFFTLTGSAARAYSPPADLRLSRSLPFAGGWLDRYQQHAGDALVLGGQVTIVRDASAEQTAVVGAYYPGVAAVTASGLSEHAAVRAVEQLTGPAADRRVQLMVDPADGRAFFRIETRRRFDERWFHWVDAASGRVIRAYNGIETASGTGVKGDTKDLTGLTTFHNAAGHGAGGPHYDLTSQDGRQVTYDMQNRQALLYYVTDGDDAWDLVTADRQSPGQPALIDAQYYANVADDFYQSELGFDWLTCTGLAAIESLAHYKRDYDNAFWSGAYLVYGDGDGTTSREYSGALDVVAHESAHAVTDCTSALIYNDESGALNESFSDVVGSSAEFYAANAGSDPAASPDWFVGEEILLTPDTAPGFRNMSDPAEDGDPDHYSERYLGTADNGGVHTNSGIPNHAYYLLVNGGQNAGCPGHAHCVGEAAVTVAGIGLAAALDIFFAGFAALPENATMCQARAATVAVGGAHAAATTDAWRAVGLTDALCLGVPPTPTATGTQTPTSTFTPTATATATATATLTSTLTFTPTATSTATPTSTPTSTPSPTSTPVPVDTDGDGCSDVRELGPNEVMGGDRDPNDFWDFFDVTEDSVIDLEDVLLILGHFGHAHDTDTLDPLLDRSSPDPAKPWRTSSALPGSLGIDVGDAIVNLQSFGHACV